MSDYVRALSDIRADLFRLLNISATSRVVEFFLDPEMKTVRTRLRQGVYGTDPSMAFRMALLEQVGPLGDAGPRLGLLVHSLETFLQLVNWETVEAEINIFRGLDHDS